MWQTHADMAATWLKLRYCRLILGEFTMNESDRIVLDPAVLAGKPVIRGTRLSVDFIIGLMADGWTATDIFAKLFWSCA